MSNVNRRKVIVCAAAVCELENLPPVNGSHRASPWGMLYSEHREESCQADDDFETQDLYEGSGVGRDREGLREAMDETLQKIREAYAQAGRDQPAEYLPLPAWEALSLELRGAFVSIYHRGRRDGILDELARAIKAGG